MTGDLLPLHATRSKCSKRAAGKASLATSWMQLAACAGVALKVSLPHLHFGMQGVRSAAPAKPAYTAQTDRKFRQYFACSFCTSTITKIALHTIRGPFRLASTGVGREPLHRLHIPALHIQHKQGRWLLASVQLPPVLLQLSHVSFDCWECHLRLCYRVLLPLCEYAGCMFSALVQQ